MATYAIGDVQGCFDALMRLLKVIDFDPQVDRLIFCGDLVNRGGQSLEVLRWIYAHQHCCETVLGNHDLSLLSKYALKKFRTKNIEFKTIFNAADVSIIMDWMLKQPLYIQAKKYLIIHAGLYPKWSVKQFKLLADHCQSAMLENPTLFFKNMYGNTPKAWSADLSIELQHRFVINASTRMRFVNKNGSLNFTQNRRHTTFKNLQPWFEYPPAKKLRKHIVFGHWSALGLYQSEHFTCLDTGKVWGGQLTALRLDDNGIVSTD